MYTLFLLFPALVLGDFLKTFSGCCLGISKALLSPNNMEVVKSDEETIRSLCGILVRMWWSYEWALERVGRVVEERRGEERRG